LLSLILLNILIINAIPHEYLSVITKQDLCQNEVHRLLNSTGHNFSKATKTVYVAEFEQTGEK